MIPNDLCWHFSAIFDLIYAVCTICSSTDVITIHSSWWVTVTCGHPEPGLRLQNVHLSMSHMQGNSPEWLFSFLKAYKVTHLKYLLLYKRIMYASLWHDTCLYWTPSSQGTVLQYTSLFKAQAQMENWYVCYYVTR